MSSQVLEIPVKGMDCAECASHVQKAIAQLPGIESVNVLLNAEKAVIRLDPARVELKEIRRVVIDSGYSVPEDATAEVSPVGTDFSKAALNLFGIVFGAILIVVVFGEGLGWFDALTGQVPFPVGVGLVLLAGYPIFRNVVRAALKRQVISHTLMSIGAFAALAIGDWVTAAIVVFFMRVGEYAERFTTERSRQALKNLTALAPQTARVERNGIEVETPLASLRVGDLVVVRPGEKIPVDGVVLSGQATVNQATITGESMPVEVTTGSSVFAATIAQLGSIRIQTERIGGDTTFGRVIRLVEEAEGNRAEVQQIADKFSGYYLPVVATIAALTFFIGGDPLATAAVLVVACSCSFALATPIAMLASVGAAAKHGLLIKGGKYIEALARADVVLLDKTGTLTLGQPQITDVVTVGDVAEREVIALAASAERYSEHPLADAVKRYAAARDIILYPTEAFESVPGMGVRARIKGQPVTVGSHRMSNVATVPAATALEAQGKTLLYVAQANQIIGVLGASDTVRAEVATALQDLRSLGIRDIVMLTGDHERVAAAVAGPLGITYHAGLLPEDKIEVVKSYQARGHSVVMVGDGVNDAPALAQAEVGIAMGVAGTDVALEAAHIALMREDWSLIPESFRLARRTMSIVKMNIGFTAIYNVLGLSLAAFGLLPPIFAAAAQSIPDLGILANSSRLIRYRRPHEKPEPMSFNWRHYAPLLTALAVGAFFAGVFIQLQIVPTLQGIGRQVLEIITTLVMLIAFIAGLLLVVFRKVEETEAQHGGVVPLPDCACCAPETPEASTTLLLTSVVSEASCSCCAPATDATTVGPSAVVLSEPQASDSSCACCSGEASSSESAATGVVSLAKIDIR